MKDFGPMLNGHMIRTKMHRDTFSILMGVTPERANCWLNGNEYPNEAQLRRIANIFGMDEQDAINSVESEKKNKRANAAKAKLIYMIRRMDCEDAEALLAELKEDN